MSFQTFIKGGSSNLLNNQTSPVNITGLIIDPINTKTYILEYSIIRVGYTGGSIFVKGTLVGRYNVINLAWVITNTFNLSTTSTITLSQLPSGQIQYTSTNLAGTPTYDKITWVIKYL